VILGIRQSTVNFHIHNALQKLEVTIRSQAICPCDPLGYRCAHMRGYFQLPAGRDDPHPIIYYR
jgi:hypothetical protein